MQPGAGLTIVGGLSELAGLWLIVGDLARLHREEFGHLGIRAALAAFWTDLRGLPRGGSASVSAGGRSYAAGYGNISPPNPSAFRDRILWLEAYTLHLQKEMDHLARAVAHEQVRVDQKVDQIRDEVDARQRDANDTKQAELAHTARRQLASAGFVLLGVVLGAIPNILPPH